MNRYALISKNGEVVNVVVAPEDWLPDEDSGLTKIPSETARIGDTWSKAKGFASAPEPAGNMTVIPSDLRAAAYRVESDPLGMKLLAQIAASLGTPEAAAFVAKRQEIRARIPD